MYIKKLVTALPVRGSEPTISVFTISKVPLVKDPVEWPLMKNAPSGLPNAEAHVPFICQ